MAKASDCVFRYGAFERAVDTTDYVYQEKMEAALLRMQASVEAAKKDSNGVAALRETVQAVAAVFDEVFGDGAANEVLGGSTSLDACTEALRALVEYNQSATSAAAQRWSGYAAQFGPNRAHRRATGK